MRNLVVVLFTLGASMLATAQTPPKPKPGTPAFFRDLTERRALANVAEDRGFYEKLLSKDFVLIGDNGEMTTKAAYLETEFGTKRPKGVQPVYSFKDFRMIGEHREFAIVSYIKTEGMKVGEQTFAADARRLDTYALEDGEWRLVAMAAIDIIQPPKTIALSPRKLVEYAGTYALSSELRSVVTVAGDRLTEQTTGHAATTLLPVGPDTFFDPNDSPHARTIFQRDDTGKVISEVYTNGDQEVIGKKVP